MNEAISKFIPALISGIVSAIVVFIVIKFGKRGAGTNSSGTEELERRAGTDNRALADAERRTREAIERARETNRESDRVIGEQAEDNRRAAENNKRTRELIERAEEILSEHGD